jgi:molybdopterin-guanine dinucleotide biosynthesis protein A
MTGVLLAGGAGTRLGGASKASLAFRGRPLASYPAAALHGVCERVAIVCKAATLLPELPGVERWDEPDEPRHPVAGIVHALGRAAGPVLVCAADMPYVTEDACRSLLGAAPGNAAAIAVGAGETCPVFGVYAPAALATLAAARADAPLREIVAALDPARVALPPAILRSVNEPGDLDDCPAF